MKSSLKSRRFGRLRVIAQTNAPRGAVSRATCWLCRCRCGRTVAVRRDNLIGQRTRSCGASACRQR